MDSHSPYNNALEIDWPEITSNLIAEHPLTLTTIRDLSLKANEALLATTIGNTELSLSVAEAELPASAIGLIFEKLFAKALRKQEGREWASGTNKEDKDVVYLEDRLYSFEIKTSGQIGGKVYGNRSYAKKADSSKNKSGYYLTVNFYRNKIYLIRFGWIDQSDWKGQKSESGQVSTLNENVYKRKLMTAYGDYRLDAPVSILDGLGATTAELMASDNVFTIRDLIKYKGNHKKIHVWKRDAEYLSQQWI